MRTSCAPDKGSRKAPGDADEKESEDVVEEGWGGLRVCGCIRSRRGGHINLNDVTNSLCLIYVEDLNNKIGVGIGGDGCTATHDVDVTRFRFSGFKNR